MCRNELLGILCAHSLALAIVPEETVVFPTAPAWGGGDIVGSKLIGRTYNAGMGPGIWVTADGGYRIYLNGELLAQDNVAGRVTFVPLTFLPGKNAISVVGVDGNGAPGVLVQADDLDTSYVSGAGWKVSTAPADNSWKNRNYDDASWTSATVSGPASITPSGKSLSNFAPGSEAKWIWAASKDAPLAVLRFSFTLQAEGYGASTTGGDGGTLTVANDSASVRKALQDGNSRVILIPEGTYDFRQFRNAATEAAAQGWTWCKRKCNATDPNSTNTFYRINFYPNSCKELDATTSIVPVSDNLQKWGNWITTKPNKTLIGMGRGAALRGASFNMRSAEGAKNQIYRNLAIYDVSPHLIEAGDGLTVVGTSSNRTSNFWADHISYKWISDGLDIEYVTGATVSWLDYDGRNEFNCYETDPYVTLDEDDELTYANVYWHATMGRVPKVYSTVNPSLVHVYNSYLDTNTYYMIGAHGASSMATAQVLFENNAVNRASYAFDLKESYGLVNWTGNLVTNSTAKFYTDGTAGTTAPTDAVFKPPYSYVKRATSSLASVIPQRAGVGGRWGSMPTYNQAFGLSNQAPVVSLTSPAAGATLAAPATLTLTATASDGDGSVKSVAFYAGTQLLGTATASPWSITANSIPAGTWSIVAVATDNSGLIRVSDFVTVVVSMPVSVDNKPHSTLKGMRVRARVLWTDVRGNVLGEEEQMLDPNAPQPALPTGRKGIALARIRFEGSSATATVRLMVTPQ